MTKHTPGPWGVHGDDLTLIGASDGRMMLARTLYDHIVMEWSRSIPEAQANARLIAAAPELLEALSKFEDEPCNCQGPPDAVQWCRGCLARNAIAKATGKDGDA